MLDALLLDVTGLAIDVRNAGQQAAEIDRSGAELRVARAVLHDVLQMEAPVAIAVPLERSEEHTSELQSHSDLVCRLLLEKKKKKTTQTTRPQYIQREP